MSEEEIPRHQEDGYDSSIPNVNFLEADFDAPETYEIQQQLYPIPMNDHPNVAAYQEKKS